MIIMKEAIQKHCSTTRGKRERGCIQDVFAILG
jgi:hypothetical protein